MTQPGWYPEPGDGSMERYWDGEQWTPATRPAGSVPTSDPMAPTAEAAVPRRRPAWLVPTVAAVVALVIAGIVLGITQPWSSSSSKTGSKQMIRATGIFTLEDPDGFLDSSDDSQSDSPGDSCYGDSGYDDLADGADVIISTDSGRTLAITHLADGVVDHDGGCAFRIMPVRVPAGHKFYGVTVTHRGTIKETAGKLTHIALTIGS